MLALPYQVYLLSYDTTKRRLTARTYLGLTLRAAALLELVLDGHLEDVNGKPEAVGSPHRSQPKDPVLVDLLQEVSGSRPRSWGAWIDRGHGAMQRAVRDHLEQAGVIGVEHRRILGIFPSAKISLRDATVVPSLRSLVTRTVGGEVPLNRIKPREAALVALAVAGQVRIAVSGRHARERRQWIDQLTTLAGPVVPALSRAIAERSSG